MRPFKKTMKKSLSAIPIYLFCVLFLGACAKIVTPVGGPKDTTPPKITKEQPVSQSVNFASTQIRITMDEFFTLDNPNANVLVSPPLKYTPEYKIKDKTLVIKIKDTLKENTTYNLVFSNCIQDYHENNKLNYYHYSFSTGSCIDSFMLKGSVLDAQSLAAGEDFTIMLYKNDIDSLPLTTLPDYISKSQKNGTFSFQNISPGSYKIFALKDINSNFLYDLPKEAVAFGDIPVQAYPAPVKDSTREVLSADSTIEDILLKSFIATDTLPKLLRYDNPAAGIYSFPFTASVNELDIKPLNKDIPFFQKWSSNNDTVTLYLKRVSFDSLAYVFSFNGQNDTVRLKPYKSKQSTPARGAAKATTSKLSVSFADEGHFYKPLKLKFSYPIQPTDSFDVFFFCQRQGKDDTTTVRISVPDTFVTEIPVPFKLESKKSYKMMIPDSVFKGYNGLTNDTIRTSFTAKSEKDYGNIILKYVLPEAPHPFIAQLWNGNQLIQENVLRNSTDITYPHLEPGNYNVRIIKDANGNGKWDVGNYALKKQPEEIIQFEKTISVRAFWDVEEEFRIDTNK